MRRTILFAAVLLVTAGTVTQAAEAKKKKPRKPNVPPKGFVALFNGKDLKNWKVDKDTAEHWSVKDGVLLYDGKGESLSTEKDYADFILCVDWKIEKGADSGIYLRGVPQVQIWDNKEGSGGLWNNQKHPRKPLVVADKPLGEWNTFKIQMKGQNVTVHLNGKLVVDNVPLEPLGGRKKGPILLQDHGHPLWFRNIFLRELKPAK